MTISDRGIHPDLLDEEHSAASSPPPPEPPSRRRRGRSEPAPVADEPPVPPPPEGAAAEAPAGEPPPPPAPTPTLDELLEQARQQGSLEEMLGYLTKNVPRETLARDTTLAGYIGDRVQHGIRDTLAKQERERAERERQEAYQRGDLYALGQLQATDYAAQEQSQKAQADLATSPFMSAVRKWQEKLPPAVQAEVQGRQFAPGGTLEDGFLEYLDAVKNASLKHGFDEEIKRREPALRKAFLSETVGSESTPERESGRATYVREITDEQIGAMSLEEYNEAFDDKGRPRNGVQVRYTRAIDPRNVQR